LDEPADLVLCDPPYGLDRGSGHYADGSGYRRDHILVVPGTSTSRRASTPTSPTAGCRQPWRNAPPNRPGSSGSPRSPPAAPCPWPRSADPGAPTGRSLRGRRWVSGVCAKAGPEGGWGDQLADRRV